MKWKFHRVLFFFFFLNPRSRLLWPSQHNSSCGWMQIRLFMECVRWAKYWTADHRGNVNRHGDVAQERWRAAAVSAPCPADSRVVVFFFLLLSAVYSISVFIPQNSRFWLVSRCRFIFCTSAAANHRFLLMPPFEYVILSIVTTYTGTCMKDALHELYEVGGTIDYFPIRARCEVFYSLLMKWSVLWFRNSTPAAW